MIEVTYSKRVIGSYRRFLPFAMLLAGSLQFLLVMLVDTLGLMDIIQGFYRQLPPLARQFISAEFIGRFTLSGVAAFGFNHPLLLTLTMLLAILVPARFMAGEIESGGMELLLALPVRRSSVFTTLWSTMMLMVLFLVVAAWCGALLARWIFPQAAGLPVGGIVRIGLNLWALGGSVAAGTLLLAVYAREYGRVVMLAAGTTLGLYFVHFLSRIWAPVQLLDRVNLFGYYSPQVVMTDPALCLRNCILLAVFTLVTSLVVARHFRRRDIPG